MTSKPSPRRSRTALTAIGAAALFAMLALATSVLAATRNSSGPRADTVTTITFRAHEVVEPKPLDIAKPAGPSLGDELVEQEILYAHGKRIGYDLIHLTVAGMSGKGPDLLVNGSLVLKDGTINFLGETTFRTIRVGVVGGTGAYQRATGELTILRTLKNGDDIDLLRIVRPATAR